MKNKILRCSSAASPLLVFPVVQLLSNNPRRVESRVAWIQLGQNGDDRNVGVNATLRASLSGTFLLEGKLS